MYNVVPLKTQRKWWDFPALPCLIFDSGSASAVTFFFIHPFPSWITSVICDESSEDWLSQIKHVLCSFQWQCYPFFCELKQRKPTLRVSRNIGNINKKRRGTLW